MESKELAAWMERRGVGQTLRAWVNNELLGRRNYTDLKSLATNGTATIKISLAKTGGLSITPTETFEGEVTNLEQEIASLKKTVKAKDKEIASLEKAPAKKKKTVKKIEVTSAADQPEDWETS